MGEHLDDAGEALQLLGKDVGRGTQDAYKELRRTLTALGRDARKKNGFSESDQRVASRVRKARTATRVAW